MRKFIFAAAAVTVVAVGGTTISGIAQAAPVGSNGIRTALDKLNIVENAQFIFEGRPHCWYDRGWHGPGWYWCGYAWRRGLGWGGVEGWNGWRREERRDFRREERRDERRERF